MEQIKKGAVNQVKKAAIDLFKSFTGMIIPWPVKIQVTDEQQNTLFEYQFQTDLHTFNDVELSALQAIRVKYPLVEVFILANDEAKLIVELGAKLETIEDTTDD